MNLDRWQPAVICIEVATTAGARNDEALNYLLTHGHKIYGDMGFNAVFVRGT